MDQEALKTLSEEYSGAISQIEQIRAQRVLSMKQKKEAYIVAKKSNLQDLLRELQKVKETQESITLKQLRDSTSKINLQQDEKIHASCKNYLKKVRQYDQFTQTIIQERQNVFDQDLSVVKMNLEGINNLYNLYREVSKFSYKLDNLNETNNFCEKDNKQSVDRLNNLRIQDLQERLEKRKQSQMKSLNQQEKNQKLLLQIENDKQQCHQVQNSIKALNKQYTKNKCLLEELIQIEKFQNQVIDN